MLGLKDLKKHPSLIPLIAIVGFGGIMAALYTMRLAFLNPDVSWDYKNNPDPNSRYANKPYKFLPTDFEPSKAPKY